MRAALLSLWLTCRSGFSILIFFRTSLEYFNSIDSGDPYHFAATAPSGGLFGLDFDRPRRTASLSSRGHFLLDLWQMAT
jgi:hypothetical protein